MSIFGEEVDAILTDTASDKRGIYASRMKVGRCVRYKTSPVLQMLVRRIRLECCRCTRGGGWRRAALRICVLEMRRSDSVVNSVGHGIATKNEVEALT